MTPEFFMFSSLSSGITRYCHVALVFYDCTMKLGYMAGADLRNSAIVIFRVLKVVCSGASSPLGTDFHKSAPAMYL